MTDFSIRHAHEAKTHELIRTHPDKEGTTATWETYAIAQAIKALWTSSCSVARFACVASALSDQTVTEEVAQKILTQLVKAGVMRSRKSQRVRLYEVNY